MSNGRLRALLLLFFLGVLISYPPAVLAQDPAPAEPAATEEAGDEAEEPGETVVEEIVVVGSRAEPRSATESMVPVDVITAADFQNQGDTDVSNLLRTLAPSYNVNTQPISDAATVVRPANLRGLAPDHTLVLINGKRRHRAAVIYWIGNGVANGAQGPDISLIPSIALKQVEVLRDGASAQYGSDAIAGVLNFQLKDATSGGSVELRSGQFKEGDGTASSVAGNMGFGLGDSGFFNFSFEYGQSDATDRSVQRDDAAALIAAGNTDVADPAQVWGSPDIDDDLKIWLNFGSVLGSSEVQFYGHANYASKSVLGGFYFRNPNNRGGVYSIDDGATLLVGDLLDARDGILDGSAGCPTINIVNNRPDPVALAAVRNNPNCFTFYETLPGGFTPNFGGDVKDSSLLFGLRGVLDNGLSWDLSASGGSNEVAFSLFNSVNASLGPDSPLNFDPGTYTQEETSVNLDLGYQLNDRTHLAGGLEWRNERFEIGLGDQASWQVGPLAAQGFSAASNGFPGFGPIAAGKWDRANYAVYLELEHDTADGRGTVGAAVRFEDFEDFGTTTNGKVSARYELTEAFQLRASVSTGFRAPTPGQSNAFNVTTDFNPATNKLQNNGTIPSSSRVAELRGGEPLEPEESTNYALGFVFEKGSFLFTADYFRIELDDRISTSRNFVLTQQEIDLLLAEGITAAATIENFRFFVNDFDTETQGVDLVATWTPPALGGNTAFSFLFNHTETEVTKFNPDTLDELRIRQLQEALPETRWNISATHDFGKFRVLGRLNYFDKWFDGEDGNEYSDKYLVDLELGYKFSEDFALVFGGQNVTDTYPDENPGARGGVGNLYSQYSPFGFNGAFYYARLEYKFDTPWGN
jgi:iron complex outermembrane receptor protein